MTVVFVAACAKTATPLAPTKPAPIPTGPRVTLTPPSLVDVEVWCARAPRPFSRCVAETAPLVLAAPLLLAEPTWIASGRFDAACAEAKTGIACVGGARVTCTDGVVTDALVCTSMGMVCSPGGSGTAECVKAGCVAGARVRCDDGLLDACNETHSEHTRQRCPNNVPCRANELGTFTCAPAAECDEVSCEKGVAQVCVAGEPRAVQCALAGWDCPTPSGVAGLSPAPCALPTAGATCPADRQPTCEGNVLRYCLGGHERTFDCAAASLSCGEDPTLGARCGADL